MFFRDYPGSRDGERYPVNDAKRVSRGRRRCKIMAPSIICSDLQQRIGSIRIKGVTGCEKQAACVVDRSAKGDILLRVRGWKSDEIRNLLAFRIYDREILSRVQLEGRSGAWWNMVFHQPASL